MGIAWDDVAVVADHLGRSAMNRRVHQHLVRMPSFRRPISGVWMRLLLVILMVVTVVMVRPVVVWIVVGARRLLRVAPVKVHCLALSRLKTDILGI